MIIKEINVRNSDKCKNIKNTCQFFDETVEVYKPLDKLTKKEDSKK